jgi:isoleucyl-tRNA synthetase
VLATALFDRPAFSNCVAHGVLLGNDQRKLSKRLKNYPDPEEFFAETGADAMRWYLCSSAVLRGQDVAIEEHAMTEPVRQVLNPIWNCFYFLCLYGGTDNVVGVDRADQAGVLDRYILAKTASLIETVTASYDSLDLARAASAISGYLDALTNWYVRRSRDRFWRPFGVDAELDADKHDAYDTLHTILERLCRVAAPLLPYLTEEVYRGLTGERSVHLTDWPTADDLPFDEALVETMDLVRDVCSAAHSIRKARGLRARLPLASMTFAGPHALALAPFVDLITDELNVKEVVLLEDAQALTTTKLSLVPAVLGPRLGGSTQAVLAAHRNGEFTIRNDGTVNVGGFVLEPGEFDLRLAAIDETVARILPDDAGVVLVDCEPTVELESEGTFRDLVRLVQQARKDAGLHVADRIDLELRVTTDVAEIARTWQHELMAQTLATTLESIICSVNEIDPTYRLSNGTPVGISVTRVD